MSATSILSIIIGILVVSSLIDELLNYLNFRSHTQDIPDVLSVELDADQYTRAREYHATNYRFSLLRSTWNLLLTIAVLASGALGMLSQALEAFSTHPILLAVLFFGTLFILADVLALPFQWYKTFYIEEKFGFNKMQAKTFWIDKLKGYGLSIVFGGLLLVTLLWLIDSLGSGFWIWFWGFFALFMLFVNYFYSSFILPLFNKLTPLETGELRTQIEAYGQKVAFPMENIYVMDGSKRSAKANAFFSGLGKQKKVVLFDTLISRHKVEELVAVLAHEIGHYKKKHILLGLVLSVTQSGVMLFVLSRFVSSPELSLALGGETYAIHLNLLAFSLLYSPISFGLGVIMNLVSRKNEFEADAYAAETYKAGPLSDALIRLHADNLSNLTPHPWYVFFNYSHPPLIQRLNALAGK